MKIALDVMGGDNAPHSNILGAKQFIENNHNCTIILVGDESLIKNQLQKYNLISKNIEIHHCSESISMSEDKPAMAFKTKPDSSIVQSIKLVKENKADAVISAGNTAALLSTSLFILGKIDQIKRPTLATHFPTRNGGFVLTDVGANTDVKPDHLLQFAIMGSIYAKHIKKTDLTNIGLLNIGAEKNKGNILTQKAHQLFEKNIKGFIGNIEPRYVFEKDVDVVVCDGFSGNIMIKLTEGLSGHLYDWINSTNELEKHTNIRNTLHPIFNNYNYESHGASPFLGVKGIVLKCHGASSQKSIDSALSLANTLSKKNIIEKIEKDLKRVLIGTEQIN